MNGSSNYPGRLITFEGIDGSGKSTQAKRFVEYLKQLGYDAVYVREPGQTKAGEMIRSIILNEDIDGNTELMLFTASRIEHIKKIIIPAVAEGKIVVCDRFLESTFAYQGHGRGLLDPVLVIDRLVREMLPFSYDCIYLDIDMETSLSRIDRRKDQAQDRLDKESIEFKERVIYGFIAAMRRFVMRPVTINAKKSVNEVSADIYDWFDAHMALPIQCLRKNNNGTSQA